MTESNVPSELDFWVHHVETLETCSICLEPFDRSHVALRFTGRNACSHIFGDTCLREWSDTISQNANKCPICRCTLWISNDPNDITNSADGTHGEDLDTDEFLEDLADVPDEGLMYIIAEFDNLSVGHHAVPDEEVDPGQHLDDANDESNDTVMRDSFSSISSRQLNEPHGDGARAVSHDAASRLRESGRGLNAGIETALDADSEHDLNVAHDSPLNGRANRLQPNEQPADSSEHNPNDTDTDNKDMQTIVLKDCDRRAIENLVEYLFHATEPEISMTHDADCTQMQERMEQCIDLALEEAGYKQPFLVAPGPYNGMLGQFCAMIIYRREYAVSGVYLEWWKDVMLSLING